MSIDDIKQKIRDLNEKGIPLPMLTDPSTKSASVSLTMMIISFNVVLIGLIGKASGFFGGINLEQAIYWYMITTGLYFGRKISSGKSGTKLEEKKEKETQ